MTTTEKRIALAEWAGKLIDKHAWESEDDGREFECRWCGDCVHWREDRPEGPCCGGGSDYFGSLEHVVVLRGKLTPMQCEDFVSRLSCGRPSAGVIGIFALINATAAEQAEAIGLALGLWGREGE